MKTNLSDAADDLRLVLETALDAVVVMNADGTIADWNEQAEEVFGWSREEALGRIMAELIIPPAQRESHRRGLQTYLDTGKGPLLGRRIEVSGLRRTGEEFPVELSIAPVHKRQGVVFVGVLRDIGERKRTEEQQKLLLAELNHRVKNMLSVITGIASQTARTSASIPEFSEKFVARIQALSRAHSMLTTHHWDATLLSDLIAEILAPYAPNSGHFAFAGPRVALKPDAILALSLIMHELITNASKYGALSVPTGQVSIIWSVDGQTPPRLHLTWQEKGVHGVMPPARPGFGTRLIEASTQHELHGRVAVTYDADGVRYDFHLPLRE